MSTSKVRTVCGSAARTDLCGGRSAMTVPTAIIFNLGAIQRFLWAEKRRTWGRLFYRKPVLRPHSSLSRSHDGLRCWRSLRIGYTGWIGSLAPSVAPSGPAPAVEVLPPSCADGSFMCFAMGPRPLERAGEDSPCALFLHSLNLCRMPQQLMICGSVCRCTGELHLRHEGREFSQGFDFDGGAGYGSDLLQISA